MTPGGFRVKIPMFYPLSLLMGGRVAESAGPSPQDTDLRGHIVPGVVPPKDASPPLA